MRYTQAEKMEIIRLVEESDQPVKRTLAELDVPRSTFYRWYEQYRIAGYDGLTDQKPGPRQFWNLTPATHSLLKWQRASRSYVLIKVLLLFYAIQMNNPQKRLGNLIYCISNGLPVLSLSALAR